MSYIDGFVIPVPVANKDAYFKVAKDCAAIFREHGALQVVECWGDDVPDGKVTSFPLAVQRKDDEAVVFSWIVWPSRSARDEGMKKFMDDPRMKANADPMPFDGKRVIYGGFKIVLDA